MLNIRIELNVTNDAFGYSRFDCGREAARILRKLADRAEQEGMDATLGSLTDANGNACGYVYHDGSGWPKPEPRPALKPGPTEFDGCLPGMS